MHLKRETKITFQIVKVGVSGKYFTIRKHVIYNARCSNFARSMCCNKLFGRTSTVYPQNSNSDKLSATAQLQLWPSTYRQIQSPSSHRDIPHAKGSFALVAREKL